MNTPNKLTVARMILVPFLVVFLLTGWGGEANRWICLAIFVAASVTDWFDGHLARKYNLITNFGFPDDHDHTSDAGFRRCFCSADTDIYLAVRCTDHYLPADLYHAEQKGPFHAGVGIRVYERSFFS